MECIKQDPVSLNRILWLDALKCFAMFLVIWGHVIQYGVLFETQKNKYL